MFSNYLEKFNFLTEYDVSKGGELLMEQLIPADFRILQTAMKQDEELSNLLITPFNKLPPHYRYLAIGEVNDNNILFDVIDGAFDNPNMVKLFSRAGDKLTGFAAYEIDPNINAVTDIKMFSFNKDWGNGRQMIKDIGNLLVELITKYDSVSWSANKENEANRYYKAAIERYGGYVENDKNNSNSLRYYINKNNGNK
jgi:hypothetical protein